MKFILSFKNCDFQFYIIEYYINSTASLYQVYKFARPVLMILNIQVQMQKDQK